MSIKLSKSKVNAWNKCPRQYKYQYIDQIETPENPAFKKGTELHSIAEEFIKQYDNGDINSESEILPSLLKLASEYDNEEYPEHCENLAKFFKRKLYDEEYKFYEAEEYLFCEEYNFSGLADLVLEDEEGNLLVIDYKTGKSSHVKNYKLELCYYKMLIEDKHPEKTVTQAGIYFTKDGNLSLLQFVDSKKETDDTCSLESYQRSLRFLNTVRTEMEAGKFIAKKQFLCKYCDYKELCDNEP